MTGTLKKLSSEIQAQVRKELLPQYISQWRKKNETHLFSFTGASMLPFLRAGDSIQVLFSDSGDIEIGDIVFITTDETVIAHRIIDIKQKDNTQMFLEMGDNGLTPHLISSDQIAGKVMMYQRDRQFISSTSPPARKLNQAIARVQRGILSVRDRCPPVPGRDFLLMRVRYLILFVVIARLTKQNPASNENLEGRTF
ncbi:hypothetical protein ACFL27_05070 [candidate division CSSED10-310 bacterium]|uniref:Signal peptidase I n=1 Tax=candidate division CSSED10-310 bacterium TaxID=2855610 RepID=A0ABV6YTN0_UNCC1